MVSIHLFVQGLVFEMNAYIQIASIVAVVDQVVPMSMFPI
jgi:hypothetical protein